MVGLVQKFGVKSWSLIASHLKGRLGKQCRERWYNHLNPEIRKDSWVRRLAPRSAATRASAADTHGCRRPARTRRSFARTRGSATSGPTLPASSRGAQCVAMQLSAAGAALYVVLTAVRLSGAQDNAIKNRWNSTLKRLIATSTVETRARGSFKNDTELLEAAIDNLLATNQLGEVEKKRDGSSKVRSSSAVLH